MNPQLQQIEMALKHIENPSRRSQENDPSFPIAVKNATSSSKALKTLSLPKVDPLKLPPVKTDVASPSAIAVLKDIEKKAIAWQQELQQVVKEIETLYAEGPILDAWLESHPQQGDSESLPRKATQDRLMQYVEEMSNEQLSCQSPLNGYQLCGLDEQGQIWSYPCPPEEVPSVSVAIARYQKLQQLLMRKSYLDTHLSQLSQTLSIVRRNVIEV